MFIEKGISIYDFVCTISEGVDLFSPGLDRHHKRVTCIAYNIAMEMNLSVDDIQDIVLAAMLHDISLFSSGEEIKAEAIISHGNELIQHTQLDYRLMKNYEPLAKAVSLIRHYHACFDKSNPDMPMGSHIINLADKLSLLFDEHRDILSQFSEVFEKISQNQDLFNPDVFEAFRRLVPKVRKRPWNLNIIKDEIATLSKGVASQ